MVHFFLDFALCFHFHFAVKNWGSRKVVPIRQFWGTKLFCILFSFLLGWVGGPFPKLFTRCFLDFAIEFFISCSGQISFGASFGCNVGLFTNCALSNSMVEIIVCHFLLVFSLLRMSFVECIYFNFFSVGS